MGSAVRAAGKEHMPNYPRGWITIRILQLIVAIVILGLCSYLVTTSVIGAGFYVQIFTVRLFLVFYFCPPPFSLFCLCPVLTHDG